MVVYVKDKIIDRNYNYLHKHTQKYSEFRHPCRNSHTALKTTLVLLYRLFLHSCLWFIKVAITCGFSPGCFSIAKVLESAVLLHIRIND